MIGRQELTERLWDIVLKLDLSRRELLLILSKEIPLYDLAALVTTYEETDGKE